MRHDPAIIAPRAGPSAADFARAKAAKPVGGDIEHLVFGEWLLTWGKPGRKSFSDWLNERDG